MRAEAIAVVLLLSLAVWSVRIVVSCLAEAYREFRDRQEQP